MNKGESFLDPGSLALAEGSQTHRAADGVKTGVGRSQVPVAGSESRDRDSACFKATGALFAHENTANTALDRKTHKNLW